MGRQPLEENGVHRAKLWEIGFYALNNTSTNTYMMLVSSISYFLIGIVGVGVVLAGSIVTIMRVWDGVTDPFVGYIVDKTNGKFGKNRPFIVAGQVIMFLSTLVMFRLIPLIPSAARFGVFIVIYAVYIVGYTCQCVVTKSAQSCLTNDPKQRPVFSMFDSVYNIALMSLFFPVYLSGTLVPKFTITTAEAGEKIAALVAKNPNLANVLTTGENGVQTLSAFYNPEMWQYMQLVFAGISVVFACFAIAGLWRKDRLKYFGTGKVVKVGLKDYADVLAHNRGIQMLVVAAGSDKLALQCTGNSTVTICLFGIICGNYAFNASNSAITSIPIMLFSVFGIGYIARSLGQKKCLVVGSIGAIVCAGLLAALVAFGGASSMMLPTFSLTKLSTWGSLFAPGSWSMFGVLFVLLYIGMKGFSNLSGSIVIPMTADCADYETYRSGRYVPGLMGTLFSFVDKLISSLGATLVSIIFAIIGFKAALPTLETPYSGAILAATLFCYLGMPAIGWILNLVSMKFYPLTKEKMVEIQGEIARIKAEAAV
ncbi:MAG: glucuronide permease [Hungatella sp.]|jgi:Na+/melibiose symporter-like transporter|nr:glucuronide permease [Hungatella sp.]